MRQVTLNKRGIAGTAANYFDVPGFPEQISIAMEHDVGFGETSGGVSIGSVIDWTSDPDRGYFGVAARMDELILNLPDREALKRFFQAGSLEDVASLTPSMRRKLTEDYPWEFADQVGDTHIEWQ